MILRVFLVLLLFAAHLRAAPGGGDTAAAPAGPSFHGVKTPPAAPVAPTLLQQADTAAQHLDTTRALALYLQADAAQPDTPLILRKIARQYSDSIVDLPADATAEQQHRATLALSYAQRAADLAPADPANLLSLALCHGTLALYSDTGDKVRYSRLMQEEAARTLALDPKCAWAHHLVGRWNYEIASLNFATKLAVITLYGGLPKASYVEAILHLQRAVTLEPDVLAHRIDLGFAYLSARLPVEARGCFEAGLAMPSREKHDDLDKARARAALLLLPSI